MASRILQSSGLYTNSQWDSWPKPFIRGRHGIIITHSSSTIQILTNISHKIPSLKYYLMYILKSYVSRVTWILLKFMFERLITFWMIQVNQQTPSRGSLNFGCCIKTLAVWLMSALSIVFKIVHWKYIFSTGFTLLF